MELGGFLRLHGKVPEDFFGERLFAHACLSHLTDDSDAWFNVHLPKVGEIDALLIVPEIGVFIVETKGHSLNQIEDFINAEILEYPNPKTGFANKSSPIIQVVKARNGLKNFLEVKSKARIPWLNISVALPRIERSSWEKKYGLSDGAAGFFFENELKEKENFISKLEELIETPIRGLPQTAAPSQKRIDLLRTVLMRTIRREVSEYVDGQLAETVTSIEDCEEKVFRGRGFSKDFVPDNITAEEERRILEPASKIIRHSKDIDSHEAARKKDSRLLIEITGNPGSGKTALLCNWTRRKLSEGNDVLYITYNKTLAAEIRRLMYGFTPVKSPSTEDRNPQIQIFDAFEYRNFIEGAQSYEIFRDYSYDVDYQKAFESRTDSLYAGKAVWPVFKYIAIDEAQDIPRDVLSMIKSASTPDAVWLVASDLNQRIYRQDEPNYFEEGHEYYKIELRISSKDDANRVSEEVAKAQIALNKNYLKPDSAIIDLAKVLQEKLQKDEEKMLPEELVPFLKLLNKPASIREIEEKLKIIYGTNGHSQARSLLIIASRHDHPIVSEIKRALRSLKLPFNDSLSMGSADRRRSINKGEIHLVTMRTARGLEADRAIVIGLADIKNDETDKSLANIALTRARIQTIVFRDRQKWNPDAPRCLNALDYLEAICAADTGFIDDTQF